MNNTHTQYININRPSKMNEYNKNIMIVGLFNY